MTWHNLRWFFSSAWWFVSNSDRCWSISLCFCHWHHAWEFIRSSFSSLFTSCCQQCAVSSSIRQLPKLCHIVIDIAVLDSSLRKVLTICSLTVVLFHYCFDFFSHLTNAEFIRILKPKLFVKCSREAFLLIHELMRIFAVKASNRGLWNLVLPMFHHRIWELTDSPANIFSIVVIFTFLWLLRILVGSVCWCLVF